MSSKLRDLFHFYAICTLLVFAIIGVSACGSGTETTTLIDKSVEPSQPNQPEPKPSPSSSSSCAYQEQTLNTEIVRAYFAGCVANLKRSKKRLPIYDDCLEQAQTYLQTEANE